MAHTHKSGISGWNRLAGWAAWAALLAGATGLRGADAAAGNTTGLPFAEAKITEVVNDVQVVHAADLTAQPAKADEMFVAPDLLQTGRRSRAQLTAEDGTVARVGSNSVFSFEPKSRTINLKQGSVLFNSPQGKGGGSIVTNSATATVLGTTLIVAATEDGGFKVLMLEGHGTIQLPNGQTVSLTAGQEVFVLPGLVRPDGTRGPSRVSTVVNFDLNRQNEGSDLVHGFVMVLPSLEKVKAAMDTQKQAVQAGSLMQTDKAVIGAVDENSIVVVDSSVIATAQNTNPNNPNNPNGGGQPNPAVVAALQTDYDFSMPPIPSGIIFLSPAIVFKASDLGVPNGLIPGNQISITGIIGGMLTASGSVDLSSLDGVKGGVLSMLGGTGFTFADSTLFTGLSTTRSLVIYAEDFSFETPSSPGPLTIGADFNADGGQSLLVLDSIDEVDMASVELLNPTGSVELGAVLGDINLDGVGMAAGAGHVFVGSDAGSVSIVDGTFLNANAGVVDVEAGRDVTISDSTLESTAGGTLPLGEIDVAGGGQVTVQNTAMLADIVNVAANDLVTVDNVNFSSTAQSISLQARTVNLYNVNFPGAAVVNLASGVGMLAPHPNTGASSQPGYVNFINNVNYAGQPAQKYVPVSAGGTGEFPTRINITKM